MTFNAILVATDLSGPDRQCHTPAATLARACGARLYALHVDTATRDALGILDDPDAYLGMVDAVRRVRVEQLMDDFEALGVEVEFHMEEGARPERVIDAFVRAHGIDLVIMGQHSQPGPFAKLLGSTTRRCLRTLDVPVLIVPISDAAAEAVAPPRGGASRPGLLSASEAAPAASGRPIFLAPTDLGDGSGAALRAAVELAASFDAEVVAMHAVELPAFTPIQAGEGLAVRATGAGDGLMSRARALLRGHLVALGLEGLRCELVAGQPAARALIEGAVRLGADMIFTSASGKGALGRLFLGSVSETLATRSPIPVLILPPGT